MENEALAFDLVGRFIWFRLDRLGIGGAIPGGGGKAFFEADEAG
jgi:hypothetical protein